MTNITQQEVIELAKEAGFSINENDDVTLGGFAITYEITKFARLIEARRADHKKHAQPTIITCASDSVYYPEMLDRLEALPACTYLFTSPQQAIPEGFKLVPIEPTDAMKRDAERYSYLRNTTSIMTFDHQKWLTSHKLDMHIDAAIQGDKQ